MSRQNRAAPQERSWEELTPEERRRYIIAAEAFAVQPPPGFNRQTARLRDGFGNSRLVTPAPNQQGPFRSPPPPPIPRSMTASPNARRGPGGPQGSPFRAPPPSPFPQQPYRGPTPGQQVREARMEPEDRDWLAMVRQLPPATPMPGHDGRTQTPLRRPSGVRYVHRPQVDLGPGEPVPPGERSMNRSGGYITDEDSGSDGDRGRGGAPAHSASVRRLVRAMMRQRQSAAAASQPPTVPDVSEHPRQIQTQLRTAYIRAFNEETDRIASSRR